MEENSETRLALCTSYTPWTIKRKIEIENLHITIRVLDLAGKSEAKAWEEVTILTVTRVIRNY